jgi:hypothetical protein
MLHELGLELRGRDLVAAGLDQLLEPIDEEEVAVVVEVAEVAAVQPPVGVDGGGGRGIVAEIAAHELRAAEPQLAGAAGTEPHTAVGVDDERLGPGASRPTEPWTTGSSGSASGAASVIPSAWATTHPRRSEHASSSPAGHGAAPTNTKRSDERS